MVSQIGLANKVEELKKIFHLDNDSLKIIMELMKEEMQNGLDYGDPGNSIAMLSTYVSKLPDGSERGSYLALDLGGTNFRVLLVKLKDKSINGFDSNIEIISEVFLVPDEVKLGDGEMFFDHIAECMSSFCRNNGLSSTHLTVGFTFSFPLQQESLNCAKLVHWNKGFGVTGVIGNDVVSMLHDALKRRNDIDCEVVAVVNDTVGTLMSCALEESDCKIGLIVGTGCNACYMEKASNIHSCHFDTEDEEMCINMEWGGFGDNGVLEEFRSEYDRQMDSLTNNQHKQLYEKMISGKYLGEIARVALCDLTEKYGLFKGKGSDKLFLPNSFLTAFVSEIDGKCATKACYKIVKNILNSLDISASDEDCDIVIEICRMVSTRAAYLCAAGIATVAKKIKANYTTEEKNKITVGVDGSVYKKHPHFSSNLQNKVDQLCEGSNMSVDFVLSHDGSGKGAAVIAAAASKN